MKNLINCAKLRLEKYLPQNARSEGAADAPLTKHEISLGSIENQKAGRILLKQFAEVLVSSEALIGRVERILQSLRIPTYLLIHSVVAKQLLLLDIHPRSRLEELHAAGKLEEEFGRAVNAHISELAFEKTREISKIRELYAEEIFDGISEISLPLSVSNEASHHENHMDMMFVVAAAKYRNARRVFEFGTYMGRTTVGLAAISPEVQVNTLNLPPSDDPRYGPYIGRMIAASPHKDRINQIYADSRNFDTEPYAAKMDYIFIDADHSYEAVKNDTEKAFEMLSPGGMVIWHDYAPKSPGVYGYLKELSIQRPLFRIKNTCLVLYIDGVDVFGFVPKTSNVSLEDA